MNINDLREAQVRFEDRLDDILKARKHLYELRSSFVKYFNRNRIQTMELDDYVLGVDLPKKRF